MKSEWMIPIVAVLAFLVAISYLNWRRRQDSNKLKRVLEGMGARRSLSFGTCLAGLPGLTTSAEVYCGLATNELIYIDREGRDVGRIPWASIVKFLSGSEAEIEPLLSVGGAVPSLLLFADRRTDDRRREPRGFLLLEWKDRDGGGRQTLFRFESKAMADVCAKAFQLYKEVALAAPGAFP